MPIETRSQSAKMEVQIQALMEMMKEMKASQQEMKQEMKENQNEMKNKIEQNQNEMKDKIEENQTEMKDRMEENQKEMKDKMEGSEKKMEENQKEIKESQSEIKVAVEDKMEEYGKVIMSAQTEFIQCLEDKLEENRKQMELELTEVKKDIACIEQRVEQRIEEEISKVENKVTADVTALKTEFQTLQKRVRETSSSGIGTGSGSKVKPPTFDGKVPWSMYLRQFEAACETNYWSEEEKATALIVALRGDALNILQTIPENDQKNYSALVAQMDMRFGDRHMQSAYQMQLRTRTQKNGETLQEFESEVARLLRLSYPTAPIDFLEQIGVETFIRGIRDTDTQQALLLARHKTLTDALGHALEFEAAKQASRSNLRVRRVEIEDHGEENKMETLLKKLQNQMDEMKNKISGLQGDRRTRGTPTCWRCGRQGHIRSSCRSRSSSRPEYERSAESYEAGQGNEE